MFINRLIQKYRYKNFYKTGVFIAEYVELIGAVKLEQYCKIAHHASISNCEIGKYTSVGRFSKLRDASIGKFCSISWDATIGAVSHPYNHITTHAFPYNCEFDLCDVNKHYENKKIIIGNDVWIGANSVVLPGVKIGDGAVIGAGAVVTHDIEPYAIVIGVPAKKIKYRFSPEIIAELCRLEWWNWPADKLKETSGVFLKDVNMEIINRLKG